MVVDLGTVGGLGDAVLMSCEGFLVYQARPDGNMSSTDSNMAAQKETKTSDVQECVVRRSLASCHNIHDHVVLLEALTPLKM